MGMSLLALDCARKIDRCGNVHKTAAEGAEDEDSLSERHVEAPNELDRERPQRSLNDKADDFDSNPSNMLEDVRPSRPKYSRVWRKPTIASEPSSVAQC